MAKLANGTLTAKEQKAHDIDVICSRVREKILRNANECVNGKREQDYGSPEDNFKTIADLWSAYLGDGVEISADDVALMMILLKIARAQGCEYHEDNYVDIAGYAACAAEIMHGYADKVNERKEAGKEVKKKWADCKHVNEAPCKYCGLRL